MLGEIGEVMAVTCFPSPATHPATRHLFSSSRRGRVADIVNKAVLDTLRASVRDKEKPGKPGTMLPTATKPKVPTSLTAPAGSSPLRPATMTQPAEVPSSPHRVPPVFSLPASLTHGNAQDARPAPAPALENILRQLAVVQQENYVLNAEYGEPFDLKAFLHDAAGGKAPSKRL